MLTREQIRGVLFYEDLIPVIRQALMDFSAGRAVQPIRTIMQAPGREGWLGVMPCIYGEVMGAKLVTFYPCNAPRQIATHMAVIQLFRTETGEPLATMDGELITEMRTAAVSAVAIDKLAARDAKVLAILGSGAQARSHVRALAGIRSFSEIRVWSRSPEHAQKFAGKVGARVMGAEEAVRGADVVLTLTSSPTPILQGEWLSPHAMVCAIGAATPDRRELDEVTMRGAVVVESREAATREAGDIVLAGAQVAAEIGELLNGAELVRGERPVVFKSVGIAIEDIATAKLAYERLQQIDIGTD
jgi:ornithine cyclodeaminase/alanine dehydrogenase-like protein (mu-crystallin family)